MITISKEKEASGKHKLWDVNNAIIKDCIMRILKKSNGEIVPTNIMVAKETGLTVTTVRKHFSAMKFEPVNHPLRVLTDEVILNIYKLSKTNSQSQKLWLQVMEGWNESVDLRVLEVPPIIVKRATNESTEKKDN
jgi:hypothetical protein